MTPLPPAPSLVSRGMLGRLGLGSLLNVVMGIAIYGFVVWVPTILVQHGLSLNRSLGQSVLMSLGGPTGALIGVLLADRLGRRRAIIGASLLGCVVGTLFAQSSSQEMAVVLGFAMFTLIYFLVAVAIANYVPELFPTATRMRGNGICSTIGRLTTIIVPQIAIALFQVGGVVAVLGGVAVALATQAVVVWLAGIETNQRSLESIAP
jgi:putative MFS transporter